jgi:hypothetical protein
VSLSLNTYSQGTDPHTQIHHLNRGAYVMCVDAMANEMSDSIIANRDSTRFIEMIEGIDEFKLIIE